MSNDLLTMTITGLKLGSPNLNGRTYPEDVAKKAISEWLAKGNCYVTVGQSETGIVHLDKVAGRVEDVTFDGEDVNASFLLLDTPKGNMVQTMIEQRLSLGLYAAGMGTVDPNGVVGTYEVLNLYLDTPPPSRPKA